MPTLSVKGLSQWRGGGLRVLGYKQEAGTPRWDPSDSEEARQSKHHPAIEISSKVLLSVALNAPPAVCVPLP